MTEKYSQQMPEKHTRSKDKTNILSGGCSLKKIDKIVSINDRLFYTLIH